MFEIVNVLKTGFFEPNKENFAFIDSLKIMLRGMLTIFFVTAILIAFVLILNRYSKKKKEKEERIQEKEIENESY